MGVFLAVCGGIDLASTLDCGQAFRWRQAEEGWVGEIAGRAVRAVEADAGLWLEGAGDDVALRDAARAYFDADRDYAAIADGYRDEPWVHRAFLAYPGLRVLRQPLFETIITFIVSANNNAGRIRRISNALCEALGERLHVPGEAAPLYAFPTPADIADAPESLLRGLGMGYRAPYVRDASRLIAGGALPADIAALPYEDAHRALKALPGVGPKVADCILLFALGHLGAIPVDVWVERVLQRGFFPDVSGKEALKRRAMERFGAHAGIAQQVLFHAARSGTLPL